MISLITTVKNESQNIEALLASIGRQTIKPDEVVIVDGGSIDGTLAMLDDFRCRYSKEFAVRIIVSRGANIARGRNLAIQAAVGDVIAVCDGGCILDDNWLAMITEPLVNDTADVVGGFYRPVAPSLLQKAIALVTTTSKVSSPENYSPSSRSIAFKKMVWEAVGGYPEWLNWGEDTLYNDRWRAKKYRFVFAEQALVYWEVRRTWRALVKQYYRYAFGDGLARRREMSYSILVATFLLAFAGATAAVSWNQPLWLAGMLPYLAVMLFAGIRRWLLGEDKVSLPLTLAVAILIHTARTWGYLLGLVSKGQKSLTSV